MSANGLCELLNEHLNICQVPDDDVAGIALALTAIKNRHRFSCGQRMDSAAASPGRWLGGVRAGWYRCVSGGEDSGREKAGDVLGTLPQARGGVSWRG